MYQYKDYNYVNYILNLSYIEGLEMYLECMDRFNDNMMWDMFLVNASNGYDKSFEDYKKEILGKSKKYTQSFEEREKEENRIINNTQKLVQLDKERRKKANAKQNY